MPTTTAAASTVDDDDIRSADIDDEVGGNFDGLTSCTESSVGYESSVELDEIVDDNDIKDSLSYSWRFGRTEAERRKSKKFPPPLSSLTQDGKPTFFLLPVRKDGRLKLRQVKSNWPETLLASRKDGRLRMHLIYSDDDDDQGSPEIYLPTASAVSPRQQRRLFPAALWFLLDSDSVYPRRPSGFCLSLATREKESMKMAGWRIREKEQRKPNDLAQ
nr:protein FANTASTIC FOUR 1 [Ipomoea batatas]